jgi:hypothetical protein
MDAHLDRFHDNVRRLCAIALARLPGMIDPATGLVVFRLDGDGLAPAGTSLRYTAITAIGVERAEQCGMGCAIDLQLLDEALDATLAGCDNSGDLGLVLWATARRDRRLAERALRDLLEVGDLVRRRRSTMVHATELAWVVIGLVEALAAGVGPEREVRGRLDRAFRRLLELRGASGLVSFARPLSPELRGARLGDLLHGELGFFDAQVYTIMAALRRDAVVGDSEAREAARAIGERLLAHQHPLGQWGWHYNARTGALVDLYPVYSVHQDGMAPMALLPLERALGVPTTVAVARGVEWLFGRNELGEAMADEPRALIWRSIRRRAPLHRVVYPLKVASLLGAGRSLDLGARLSERSMLEVDRELRPYHLGWCLLAFAELAAAHRGRGDAPPDSDPRPTLKTGQLSEPAPGSRASNPA